MEIGRLSKELGVPVPTLRRWTQEFAGGLSAGAKGGDGRSRQFNRHDQALLTRARDLLASGDLTYAAVRFQLAGEGLIAQQIGDLPGPATPEERELAERFVSTIAETIVAPLRERLALLESRIETLSAEIVALRGDVSSSERPPGEGTEEDRRRRWPFR